MDTITLHLNEPITMRAKLEDFAGELRIDRFTFDRLPNGQTESLPFAINCARTMHMDDGTSVEALELLCYDLEGGIRRGMAAAFDAARGSSAA